MLLKQIENHARIIVTFTLIKKHLENSSLNSVKNELSELMMRLFIYIMNANKQTTR